MLALLPALSGFSFALYLLVVGLVLCGALLSIKTAMRPSWLRYAKDIPQPCPETEAALAGLHAVAGLALAVCYPCSTSIFVFAIAGVSFVAAVGACP